MENKLKSCPFCGGEAERFEQHHFAHSVVCKKCHATIQWYKNKQAAAKAWNRRTASAT